MGITMEFYAANPEAFVTLQKQLASPYLREEEEQRLDDQMRGYPHADFSLHLRWPDDIDALCLALVAEGLQVPSSTDGLLEEELWFDGTSAFVGQLSHTFPLALAQASDLDLLNEESFRQGKQGCPFHHSLSLAENNWACFWKRLYHFCQLALPSKRGLSPRSEQQPPYRSFSNTSIR